MTGSQYNNVVQWTLANTPAGAAEDSFEVARAVFNNMGVAFPHGDSRQIILTLLSGEYMGWLPCTYAQAQEQANMGTAVMGIDTDHVVVVLPDETVGGRIAPAAAVESAYARTTADIPTTERVAMQFYAYNGYTSTTAHAMISDNQLIGQSNYVEFPEGSGFKGDAFHSNAFISKVCGKSTLTASDQTISTLGCAVCCMAMFILYMAGLTNTNDNVYYAVKEAAVKGTNSKFQYNRASFIANVGGRSVTVDQVNDNILPARRDDLTPIKNSLLDRKAVILCLKTGPADNNTHYVLADELIGTEGVNLMDRIRVADPAQGGKRWSLRQAIERKMPARVEYVLSGYKIW